MEEATGLAVEKTRSFFVRCRIDAPRYGLYEDEIRSVEGSDVGRGGPEGTARSRITASIRDQEGRTCRPQ